MVDLEARIAASEARIVLSEARIAASEGRIVALEARIEDSRTEKHQRHEDFLLILNRFT